MIRINHKMVGSVAAELDCGCVVVFEEQPAGFCPAAVRVDRRCVMMGGIDLVQHEAAWLKHIRKRGIV